MLRISSVWRIRQIKFQNSLKNASILYLFLKFCLALNSYKIFWMGTKAGGSFFGKVGSFEPGYELDALVLDESRMPHPQALTLRQRLERYICLSENGDLLHKYVSGNKIL